MRGHTLFELTFVLLLLGIAVSALAPTARRLDERSAVAAAREAVVGLIAEARAAAIETGDARVRIALDPGTAELVVAGTARRALALTRDFGVSVELSGARREAELHYDALGLGRMASLTIVFRRARAAAELVVSSYGRVRRR